MGSFNYVVLKSDNTKILMYGYTDFDGQFDTDLYEQVNCDSESDMPEGWVEYRPPTKIESLHELVDTLTYEEQKEVMKLLSTIIQCLNCGYSQIAVDFVNESSVLTQSTKNTIIGIITS